MAEIEFSKQGSPATTTVGSIAPPPTFNASMMRDGAIGALISIGVGFGLLFIQLGLFPELNLNMWMVTALQDLMTRLGQGSIGMYLGAVLGIPNTPVVSSPFYFMQFFYAAFLSFPSNVGWLLGGLIVGYKRVRSGRDEGNLKAGWDTFWYGMLSIEIPFLAFLAIFLICALIPGAAVVATFAGSLLFYLLLFFLMPMFWLGLIFALIGSMIGSTMGRK